MNRDDPGPNRRQFIRAVTAGLTTAAAGCVSDSAGGAYSDHYDVQPMPTRIAFGYGGSPTEAVVATAVAATEAGRATDTDHASTESEAPTTTETGGPTATPNPSASPLGDSGRQAFGQFGYGG